MNAPTLPPDPGWMGDPRRGASLGRYSHCPHRDWHGHLYLRRVPISRQGYDSGGAYWGIGAPLYWATDGIGVSFFFRARDRNAAKAAIRRCCPYAQFHR